MEEQDRERVAGKQTTARFPAVAGASNSVRYVIRRRCDAMLRKDIAKHSRIDVVRMTVIVDHPIDQSLLESGSINC